MTEAEWLTCTDPARMWRLLHQWGSDRKLRLFVCARRRRLWHLCSCAHERGAIEIAEQHADGQVTAAELDARIAALREAHGRCPPSEPWRAAAWLTRAEFPHLFRSHMEPIALASANLGDVAVVRDLIGNPFRPVAVDPAWLSWNDGCIPHLARAIYDERRFGDLPVLADALEEAGCADADLLGHCREPRDHVRGCWALDLLLGKG